MSNRNAWVLAVAGLLVLAPVAGATTTPAPAKDTRATPPAADDDEAAAPRPFIERSLVLVPERAGALTLADVHVYERSEDGIGYRYRHPDFPDVRIDLFVYPRGRADRGFALEEGMAGLRASIDYAVAQGGYTDLTYGDEGPIDLRLVGADGSRLSEAPAAADDQDDRHLGRRLALQLSIQGEPLDSRAFLFYDALYLIKGRISASPQDLPGEAFDRFADRAMADLVPAVTVRNTGGCAEMTIHVDPESKDGAGDLTRQLMRALTLGQGEACAPTLDESVPDGFRGTVLAIDPAMWAAPAE